jgi:hypothetical protein
MGEFWAGFYVDRRHVEFAVGQTIREVFLLLEGDP